VSLSPQCLRSAPTPDVTAPAARANGARGCDRWSRSVACVPTAAKERAPHGERVEVLRLHVPQTWGLPRRPVRTVSLGAAPSKARAAHVGVVDAAAPTTPLSSAPHTYGGAVRTARGRQTFGKCRRSSRSFRGFFRTSPVRVTSDRAERRKVAAPPARSPWVGLRFHNRSCPQLFHSEVGDE
jgi:hypothetical protein